MISLKESKVLQRKIRVDDIEDMGTPTWTLVRDLIRQGRTDEALELIDYEVTRSKVIHDLLVQFIQEMLDGISRFDEEEVGATWRRIIEPLMQKVTGRNVTPELVLQLDAELQRCHYGETRIVEEDDRYVLTCDPCGAGGRLRKERSGAASGNAFTKHSWPWDWDVGETKKPYPWSWSRVGVPYYCAHCAIMWEILPTELLGYPVRIHIPGEKPEDPCVHLYYKRPELIPEEYFTRIGKAKTIR